MARGKPVIARKSASSGVMFNGNHLSRRSKQPSSALARSTKTWWTRNKRAVIPGPRLVGYKISSSAVPGQSAPWRLSAGRMQTVALRLIVDREIAIRAFVPVEYWTIHAVLAAGEPPYARGEAHQI